MTDTPTTTLDTSRVDKVKINDLPDLVTELLTEVNAAETEDSRKELIDLVAVAAAKHVAARRTEQDPVIHEVVTMPVYSSGEGVRGQEMRYAAERAELLARLASPNGVAAAVQKVRYRYSGGRKAKLVHLFGAKSDVERTIALWTGLNPELTRIGWSIPEIDKLPSPTQKTRERRKFILNWVTELAGRVDELIQTKVESTSGAANRVSDRHSAAEKAMDEWAAVEAQQTGGPETKTELVTRPDKVESDEEATEEVAEQVDVEPQNLDEVTEESPEPVEA